MTSSAELRLRRLLAWAVEYVERENKILEECHTIPGGHIDDIDVSIELKDSRRWLNEARAILGLGE